MSAYYKIRNKDGLFSSGGSIPSFKPQGKIWKLPQLKAHLRMLQKYSRRLDYYNECELVAYKELVEPADIKLEDLLKPLEEELVMMKLRGRA